jgi:glycosyltransferase involved in cell wall biosynthesis
LAKKLKKKLKKASPLKRMTFYDKSKIAVVVPAFNEEQTISQVVEGLKKQAGLIVVVDDGSSDKTGVLAKQAGATVISHKNNQGYDQSIEDGFNQALKQGAEIVITFDADGQHQASDIPGLIAPILQGEAGAVAGERARLNHWAEKIFAFYTKKKFGIKDPLCGLKAYHRKVYSRVGHFDTLKSIGTQLILEAAKKGFIIKTIPIEIVQRKDQSRFYKKKIKANLKIFKAMLKVIWHLKNVNTKQ